MPAAPVPPGPIPRGSVSPAAVPPAPVPPGSVLPGPVHRADSPTGSTAGPTNGGSLAPATFVDSDHPAVARWAADRATGTDSRQRAVALYYAVRDGFRYDPYRIDLSDEGMKASAVLARGYGWCVPKAALLAACCRAVGIPARVGFADVRNHLSTARLRDLLGTDLYIWHGYTDILVDGRWVKATPAFNIELCDRFGLLPLEFDGRDDSIYHPYDRSGQRHMEYVNHRGGFDDVPLERIRPDFEQRYPRWLDSAATVAEADFLVDAAREIGEAGGGSGTDGNRGIDGEAGIDGDRGIGSDRGIDADGGRG